jgi:hypothetical protein
VDLNESAVLQLAQRLPHGRAANLEFLGQGGLPQRLADWELPAHNPLSDPLRDLVNERRFIGARSVIAEHKSSIRSIFA